MKDCLTLIFILKTKRNERFFGESRKKRIIRSKKERNVDIPSREMVVGRWELRDGSQEMGVGRWEMGVGRWESGDGNREMGVGRWESGDRSREMGVGRWESGDWSREMGVERWEMEVNDKLQNKCLRFKL